IGLWANLHAGFMVGFVILFLRAFTDSFHKRKLVIYSTVILLASILASLINPYGVRLWFEIVQPLTDQSIHHTISEWQPSYFSPNIFMWSCIVLSLAFLYFQRKKFSLLEFLCFGVLLI